ncbi:uncharacterized protein LOC128710348 [Anopheles marshallii]|uniref:uncharacterized protein LOC128710348 n=1 Tax=Anopheles marshallii TaxID=1521116 RepID=UPI00237C4850|nr:uncharacterized protein LOC128710348 [Anopheles marshallii]
MRQFGRYAIVLVLLCLLVASSLAQTCGERKVANFLIVNGTESKDGYWPWHVALFHNNGRAFHYACGGTILDHNIVLTAAHCLMTENGVMARERLVVQVGRNRLRSAGNRVQEHEAYQLIVHPEFTSNSNRHDIALIKLATDITYTDYIQPICLWNRGEDQHAIVGTWGTVIGFGVDETGNVSNTLREATIPVVRHITCIESNRKAFAYHLTSNMFCAGSRDGIGACNGDSGGGMFFQFNDVWFVRGIVSFTKLRQDAPLCDTKEYTVFTDVAMYLHWIKQHMRGAGGQPVAIGNNRKIALLPMSTCGANPYASRDESLKPVLLGYPWVALLEYSESGSDEKKVSSVRLGEYDMDTGTDCAEVDGSIVCSPPVQSLPVESVTQHKDYDRMRLVNDIALIRVRDRVDTSQSNVKPICLPVTNELRSQKSTHYIVTGWDEDYTARQLKSSQWELIESTECHKLINDDFSWLAITTRQICMQQQNGTECKRTFSSAPLQLVQQVLGKQRYVLYGVLLFGSTRCNLRSPYVFTNVASYMDWILENIQE